MAQHKAVLGLIDSDVQAESIVSALQSAGFARNDISALLSDKKSTREFSVEHNTKAPEGAAIGAGAGGVAGGTVGLLVGLGALAIPGLGPLIAAGPIVAALAGLGAGAAAGGLGGALIGLGVPEMEAKAYEGKIKDGKVLLSVHVEDRDERASAKQILENGGAHDIVTVGEAHGKDAVAHNPPLRS